MRPGGFGMGASTNVLMEQMKEMPAIPPGVNKKELLDAVAKHTMRDDWSCAAGPPKLLGDELPGLRYGASLEIRPKLFVLPCPCPGGSFNKAWRDSAGSLQPSGLWAKWPKPDDEEQHTSLPPLFPSEPASPPDGDAALTSSERAVSSSSTPGAKSVGDAKSSFETAGQDGHSPLSFNALGAALASKAGDAAGVSGMYHPGGEPYSADYGCLKGFKKSEGPLGEMVPGKRWWNMPDHSEVAIATPCPCMLGPYTGLQPKLHEKLTEALAAERGQPEDGWKNSVDDRYTLGVPKVPEWQTAAGGMRLGHAGLATALLAGGQSSPRSSRPRQRSTAVMRSFL